MTMVLFILKYYYTNYYADSSLTIQHPLTRAERLERRNQLREVIELNDAESEFEVEGDVEETNEPRRGRFANMRSPYEVNQNVPDLYETPEIATQCAINFIKEVLLPSANIIYEPCAGKLAISNVLTRLGYCVINRDLYFIDKFGVPIENPNENEPMGSDFFDINEEIPKDQYDVLVTNPPFHSKHIFLEKCIQNGKPFALLLPFNILTNRRFEEYGKDVKLIIRTFHSNINFLRNGNRLNCGEIIWVFGNFPMMETMEHQYDFNFFNN